MKLNIKRTNVNVVENVEPDAESDGEQGKQQGKNLYGAKRINGIVPSYKRAMRIARIKSNPEPTTQRLILTGPFLEVASFEVADHSSCNEEFSPDVQEHHILRQQESVVVDRSQWDKHSTYLQTSPASLNTHSDAFINKPRRPFTFPVAFKEKENENIHTIHRCYSDPPTQQSKYNTTSSMVLNVKSTNVNLDENADFKTKSKCVQRKQQKIKLLGAKLINGIAPINKRAMLRTKRKVNPGPTPQRLSSTGPFLESCDSIASFELVNHSSCNEESLSDEQEHLILKQQEPVIISRLQRGVQSRDKHMTYLQTTSLPCLNTYSDNLINKPQMRYTYSVDIKEKTNKDFVVYFLRQTVKGRSPENYFQGAETNKTRLPSSTEPKGSSYQPFTLAELVELRPFLDVNDSLEDFDCLDDSLSACSQELSVKPTSRIQTQLSRFKQSCKKLIPKLIPRSRTEEANKIHGLQRENSCLVKSYNLPENRTRNIRIVRPGQPDPMIISGADTLGGLPEGEGSQSRFLTSWSLSDDTSGCYGDGDTDSPCGHSNPAVGNESTSRSRSKNSFSPRRKVNKNRTMWREDPSDANNNSNDSEESSSKRRSAWSASGRVYSGCRDLQPRAMHFLSPGGQGRVAHAVPRAGRLLRCLSSSSLDSQNSQLTSHRSTSSADESCAGQVW